ncbi:uncharacterized protein LOC124118719 isoform X1 [Haliotis rufescens]|uniref:uncharacterized protein LOC124118719 isoform X1 n=2 Tax=Haliotis rufescens TaxID=6454 RepID=UPI001EB02ABA|nr:uncharacterized protein LOC124118719 isoform X1 [Haliotis rufescens]
MATGVRNTKPSLVTIVPGLKSTGKTGGKLLRRPQVPKPLPPLSPCPSPKTDSCFSPGKTYEAYNEVDSLRCDSQEIDFYQSMSPIPSGAPSLVSPPPSESVPTRRTFRMNTYTSPESHGTSFISRDDLKYVLDPLFRGRSTVGTYIDGKRLTKPFKPRGPDPFPPREPRTINEVWFDCEPDEMRYYQPPTFTLDNFLRHVARMNHVPMRRVKEAVCSQHNYKKLTKLLAETHIYPPVQQTVHQVTFTPEGQNVPACEPRIPQRQLLYEMAAMIKSHVRELINTEVKTVIKQMPKYSPSYQSDKMPHTEIILYEDDTVERLSFISKKKVDSELPASDAVFHSAQTQYFQGSGRSRSPFTVPDDGVISPSELAILDSLISGGTALSLKAHFISEVPDVTPLVKTVTYLNLSFNDFRGLPLEVLEMSELEVLKLRNNPLIELPPDINKLGKLRTLVVSFCLMSSLPISLFDMTSIEHLDISYNRITFIPNEICKLRKLLELNVEGNQLPALPGSACRLSLRSVNVRNNLMHPLFWRDSTKNQPQRLIDLAALAIHNSELVETALPQAVCSVLQSKDTCDCCRGALFGPGLRIIRPVTNIFGVKNLPFLFRSCSTLCLYVFRHSTDTLAQMLYGGDAIKGL